MEYVFDKVEYIPPPFYGLIRSPRLHRKTVEGGIIEHDGKNKKILVPKNLVNRTNKCS